MLICLVFFVNTSWIVISVQFVELNILINVTYLTKE